MTADVTIVGAGPAGCSAALELVRLGRSVVMVTRGHPREERMFGECLPPAGNGTLRRLGLPAPDPQHHLPSFANESSWGHDGLESKDFILDAYGHGWHLDRAHFDASLRAAVEAAGVTIRTGDYREGGRFLMDCTGRGAQVASRMGARAQGNDRLVAFAAMACLGAGEDTDCSTLIESAAEGWWYSARLTNRRRVLAFHTDGDLAAGQSARRHQAFLHLLGETRYIKERMQGYVIAEGFPVPLAAGGRWLRQAYGQGWAAAGDAAQCYDPLSSQGLVYALESGNRVAFGVHMALDGDYRHLARYQTMLELERARYERRRLEYYGLERRWPESGFWRRRLANAARLLS